MDFKRWANEHKIHEIVAGSHLYGTARPDSDVDIRGVCLMPTECLLGLSRFDQWQDNQSDTVIYGITKFFDLALGANPNIVDILCAPRDTWRIPTDDWQSIYFSRSIFLSQRIRHTFSGYAYSQLKRLENHYRWLINPPTDAPTLEQFGGKLESDPKGGQKKVFPHLDAERRYEATAKYWKQYQTWLQERNPARAALEAKYGYDTKHASHLVRLLLQAVDILEFGDYNPRLNRRALDTVLDVLRGEWEYEQLIDWAQAMEAQVKSMDSVLPNKPDRNKAERLLMGINFQTCWI